MRAYLVVALVFVILASITFPAVQAARESARHMQCGNNMKLHCIALQNYSRHFSQPPPWIPESPDGCGTAKNLLG